MVDPTSFYSTLFLMQTDKVSPLLARANSYGSSKKTKTQVASTRKTPVPIKPMPEAPHPHPHPVPPSTLVPPPPQFGATNSTNKGAIAMAPPVSYIQQAPKLPPQQVLPPPKQQAQGISNIAQKAPLQSVLTHASTPSPVLYNAHPHAPVSHDRIQHYYQQQLIPASNLELPHGTDLVAVPSPISPLPSPPHTPPPAAGSVHVSTVSNTPHPMSQRTQTSNSSITFINSVFFEKEAQYKTMYKDRESAMKKAFEDLRTYTTESEELERKMRACRETIRSTIEYFAENKQQLEKAIQEYEDAKKERDSTICDDFFEGIKNVSLEEELSKIPSYMVPEFDPISQGNVPASHAPMYQQQQERIARTNSQHEPQQLSYYMQHIANTRQEPHARPVQPMYTQAYNPINGHGFHADSYRVARNAMAAEPHVIRQLASLYPGVLASNGTLGPQTFVPMTQMQAHRTFAYRPPSTVPLVTPVYQPRTPVPFVNSTASQNMPPSTTTTTPPPAAPARAPVSLKGIVNKSPDGPLGVTKKKKKKKAVSKPAATKNHRKIKIPKNVSNIKDVSDEDEQDDDGDGGGGDSFHKPQEKDDTQQQDKQKAQHKNAKDKSSSDKPRKQSAPPARTMEEMVMEQYRKAGIKYKHYHEQ